MCYVYRHIRLDSNEPFYIGVGSDTNYKRAFLKHKRSKFWNEIVNKAPYEVEIMLDDLTLEEACEKEKEFIRLYGRKELKQGTLVNLTDGGDGRFGSVMSDKEKKRLSEYMKGNTYTLGRHMPDEEKERRRIASTGKKHSEAACLKIRKIHKGKVVSEETKKKLSESHKGYVMPQSQKDKIRIASTGRVKSAETIRKSCAAQKGRIISVEHRRKLSSSHAVFSDNQIKEIRRLSESGLSHVKISRIYNCSAISIHCIVRFKTYKYVE